MPTFSIIKTHTSRLGPRIQSWIDATEPGTPGATDPKPKASRKRPSHQKDSNPRPAKRVTRRALACTSGNNIPQPTNNTMDPTKQQQKDVPARNTRSSGRVNATTPSKQTRSRALVYEDSDDEPTPNANRTSRPQQSLPTRMQLPPRPILNPTFSEANDAYDFVQDAFSSPSKTSKSRTESTESGDKSHLSKRSTSPNKMAIFRMAKKELNCETLGGATARTAGGVMKRYPELLKLSFGEGVIPGSLRKIVEKNLDPDEYPPQHCYSPDPNFAYPDTVAEKLLEILQEALRCEREEADEPAWNSAVHGKLLSLVVKHPRYNGGLAAPSITTARIQPGRLAVDHMVDGYNFEKKMVDFAVVMKSGNDFERIRSTIANQPRDSQSVSQSTATSLMYDPACLFVESKLPFTGGQAADVQLTVWALSGLTKLRQLLVATGQGDAETLTIPLVTIHGHLWHLSAIHERPESDLYLGKLLLGSTASLAGLFQIMKALHVLVHWGHTEYRTWWFSKVAKPN